MHRDVLEFMGLAKHMGSTCIVNTNGTLLSRNVSDELILMNFDELKITALAGSREMYVQTHPGVRHETFDKLRDNLLYLSERKAELGVRRPKVSLVFYPIPQNYTNIMQFAEFAHDVHADSVSFRPVDTVDDPGLRKHLVPTSEQATSVRKQLADVTLSLETAGVAHNIDFFMKVFRKKINTADLYRVIPCYYGWLGVRIDVDGQLYPCCRCYEPIGNICEKKFLDIWHGRAYRTFRKKSLQINRGQTYVDGCTCDSCQHYTANMTVFKVLQPMKSRSSALNRLSLENRCENDV